MERVYFGTGPVVGNKQAVQFVQLGPTTGQWQDIEGNHVAYAPVEYVEYRPTITEQILALRAVVA